MWETPTARKVAVYAGSFDPFTKGHLWVVNQAAPLFDEVLVVVAENTTKKSMFSAEDRAEMICRSVQQENVRVAVCAGEFLVKFAAAREAKYLIRGVRSSADFEYEHSIQAVNAALAPDISTLFFLPPREYADVSSSVVRGCIGLVGWEKIVARWVPPYVLYRLMTQASSLWRGLVKVGAASHCEKVFWERALWPYFGDTRHYHNWLHFAQTQAEFENVKFLCENPLAVQFALALHDVVYDSRAMDNEEKSAEYARELIKLLGLEASFADRVAQLILYTKHKELPPESDRDALLLCDIDLSIFGASDEEFDEYEKGIRAEYAWVPVETFREKRRAILWGMLLRCEQHGGLFLTRDFNDRYRAQAKRNLQRSYDKLKR